MTVTVGAMWRDSTRYMERSLGQYEEVADLLAARGDRASFVFVENDSTDDTYAELVKWGRAQVHQASDNCPYYPSVDRPERWRHLAWVANTVLDNIPDESDVFVWLESDLVYNPADVVRLIDATEEWPVAAAMNLCPDGRYYDIFGTRCDGRRFVASPPYHPQFDGWPMVVESAGGCVAMRAAIARNTRNQPEDGYVGWMRDVRRLGFPVVLDPSIQVFHP